jgi:hypothetical protein
MKRRLFIGMLCLALIAPAILVAETPGASTAAKDPMTSAQQPKPSAASPQDQQPSSARPGSTTRRRSYERQVQPRRHSPISRKEAAFMGAIAGTSMGIGAIAGGGTGLAIGAIVGGWGAYVGHRLWHRINK